MCLVMYVHVHVSMCGLVKKKTEMVIKWLGTLSIRPVLTIGKGTGTFISAQ